VKHLSGAPLYGRLLASNLIVASLTDDSRGVIYNQNIFIAQATGVSLDFTGNTKGGSITVPLTSCLTGLD
jgi:hypothetical protein